MMQRFFIYFGSFLLLGAFVHAQSLPEVAKLKTTDLKAKRVFTNEDFPKAPPPKAVAEAQAAAAAEKKKPAMDIAEAADIIQQTTSDINLNEPIIRSLEDHLKAASGDSEKEDTLRQQIDSLKQNVQLWTAERDKAKEVIAAAAKKPSREPSRDKEEKDASY